MSSENPKHFGLSPSSLEAKCVYSIKDGGAFFWLGGLTLTGGGEAEENIFGKIEGGAKVPKSPQLRAARVCYS